MSEPIFAWLHISDLHVGSARSPGAAQLVQAIKRDLASASELGLPSPDAIFVAGDIASTGDARKEAGEYEEARALLVDLANAAGLGPHRVFVVPGNHDVQRTADADRATFRLVQSLRAGSEGLDDALANPEDRALLVRRLENYLRFAKGFAPACLQAEPGAPDTLFWTHRMTGRGKLPVRVVGLNTALIATGDDDMGKLQSGVAPLTEALREPALLSDEVVLVLSHHPLIGGWLLDEEELRPWLKSFASILLSGQSHEEQPMPSDAAAPIAVSSGRRSSTGFTYSIGAIHHEGSDLSVRVWPRVWLQEEGRFAAPATTALGTVQPPVEWRIDLRRRERRELEGPGGLAARKQPWFLDRSVECSAIRRALDAAAGDRRSVAIAGPPGVGKTALVEHYLATEASASFPDGAAWIDGSDLAADVLRVARRFGWKAGRAQMMEDARAWLDDHLREKQALLVVDNADSADAEDLPQPQGACRMLLIRDDLTSPDTERPAVRIGPWDTSTAKAYLRELAGDAVDLSEELLDRIAEAGAGLPLALRLLAGTVFSKPAADLEPWLRAIETSPSSKRLEAIVTAVVEDLPPQARELLFTIAASAPKSRILITKRVGSIVWVRELQSRYIAEDWNDPHRPLFHPAVHRMLRAMEGASPALKAHDEWIDWIAPEAEAGGIISDALHAIDRRLAAGRADDAVSLAIRVQVRAINAGRVGELAYRYARAVKQLGSTAAAVAAAAQLGELERDFGSLDRAFVRLEYALRFSEERNWKEGQVVALMDLGTCHHARGAHTSAVIHYERALAIARAEQLRDRELSLLGNLGVLHRDLGDLERSVEYLGQALHLVESLGLEDHRSGTLIALALSYRDHGDLDRATELLEQALRIEKVGGNKQRIAQALETLGTCEQRRGDSVRAIELHQEALTIYEEIGSLRGQALQLANLGKLHDCLGQHQVALSLLNEARKRFLRSALPETHEKLVQLDFDIALSMSAALGGEPSSFYVTRAAISRIRSLDHVVWQMPPQKSAGWHVIVGENGAGKSTLLRSLALALIGTKSAAALRQDWSRWLREGEAAGDIEVTVARTARRFPLLNGGGREDAGMPPGFLRLALRIERKLDGVSLKEETEAARSLWESSRDAFSAGYGPFRRFADVDLEYERALAADPAAGRHVSLFDSRVTLAEAFFWLRDLQRKKKEGAPESRLLEPFLRLLGDPGPPALLPQDARLIEGKNGTGEVVDGNGFAVPFEELSDGFRSVLSLQFDLVRHLAKLHGEKGLFSNAEQTVVTAGGVVLIDEIDVHLHPTWQQRIGPWLKRHFPNVQFIVTTHSPLVCQSADSVFVLPTPGTEEEGRMLQGTALDRLRYGNVLDALSTGIFGRGVARSDESRAMLQRLVQLNRKEVGEGLSAEETEEQQRLRAVLGTEAPLTAVRGDAAR